MEKSAQISRARRFRDLHGTRRLLLLPNAWDAVSARLFAEEGFPAVATTSAGVASALGFPDGEVMPFGASLAVARCIADRVEIPVSLDLERGYASGLRQLHRNVVAALEAGIVGLNLEDGLAGCGPSQGSGLRSIEEQCERIQAVREAARSQGVPLVLNARTDVFLVSNADATREHLADAIRRGNRYREAGADCVFVPDLETLEEPEMAVLARELEAPLNLIAGRRTPSVSRLEQMGVSRLSFGPRPMRALLSQLQRMAREWLEAGTYDRMLEGALSYETVNQWFGRPGRPPAN